MKWSYIVTGKTKVAFDYNTDITGKESLTFTMLNTKNEEIEKTIAINDQFYLDMIDHNLTKETETQKALTVNYKEGSATKQYKIGEGETWINYTNSIRLDDYQILETLGNESREVKISLKQVDKIGNEIITNIKYTIPEIVAYKQEDTVIEGESIIACVENNNLETGNYIFRVTGTTKEENEEGVIEEKTETIDYPVELYNYNEEANYKASNEIVVNNTKYTGIGKTNSEKRMLILKYNKSLNINEGATITPTGTSETINGATHLCTKKGMFIYCAETLTNNGEVTMTAKGTVNQEGENVYLYKNEDNSYEYVPAIGGLGGAHSIGTDYDYGGNGKIGKNGTERKTGGGGSGATTYMTSGAGGSGTSYSGGSGGGGASGNEETTATSGSSIGGTGGRAGKNYVSAKPRGAGGGAGNPGGKGAGNGSEGKIGTGGLLIIYTNIFIDNATINANGSAGGSGIDAGGGGSGGGSINIFYKELIKKENINAVGGIGGTGGIWGGVNHNGGTGGDGSITIGNISTGTFIKDE